MITVKALPSCRPQTWDAVAHHVGKPPRCFRNPWPSFKEHGLLEVFKLRFGSNVEKNFVPVPQGPNGERSEELVRVQRPDWGSNQKDRLRATWLGHASFLIETPADEGCERGIRILCDPVFSDRTSPLQFFGPKRYTPPPCALDELPDIDIVCISHDHYDHLDYTTIKQLQRRFGVNLHFLVGLGNTAWFTQHVCQATQVTEADWWDRFQVAVDGVGNVVFTCCPTQHLSGRTPMSLSQTLWCGWAVESGGKKAYFAGDTGYQAVGAPSPCPAFTAIGQALGPFDLALLPIGLMSPASFMGSVHATPEQSLAIHGEMQSRLSIGMHYGTVRGGISSQYEDVRDPPRRWKAAAEKEGIWGSGVALINVGETVTV
ncbi:Metallo-hydrolase/oxidoreductase [Piedraia hortae CBS 480.64]|uniref:Metallo-hydrolase/oxidoreductase n=1 Tax=Piedraia hortae CBS 480.64 TaxID=1314780 RepID=A0A6A7C0G4_9PEZI|nr:Metallo-hydrolase/oxidoreductase [Piedraia hortae CBS 480.64]